MKAICVICGSNAGRDPRYASVARELGHELASRGLTLVYGGAGVGLMGKVADAVLDAGGEAIGIITAPLAEQVGHPKVQVETVATPARTQATILGTRGCLHRPPRRLRHPGRTLRGDHLEPTRHPRAPHRSPQRRRLLRPPDGLPAPRLGTGLRPKAAPRVAASRHDTKQPDQRPATLDSPRPEQVDRRRLAASFHDKHIRLCPAPISVGPDALWECLSDSQAAVDFEALVHEGLAEGWVEGFAI